MTRRGHNEGSITKRKDGRYYVRIRDGNARRGWYADSLADAKKLLREKLLEQQQGGLIASASQSLEKYLWDWHDQRAKVVSYGTQTNYAANIRRALPYIGHLKLDQVRAAHLDAMYAKELGRGLTPESVQQLHRTLRAAFSQAIKRELIFRNPTTGATPPQSSRDERAIPTPEDVATIIRATAADRLGALWALLATTGLRSGEAIGLRWEDLNTERGHLTIHQTAERRKGQGIAFKGPKTPRSKRTVLLLPGVVRRLEAIRAQQVQDARETDTFPPALIFTTEVGTPLDVSAVNRKWHRALNKAGLPSYRVHDLRHAVTSFLIGNGVPTPIVQSILGHASSRMTTEVYTHLAADHQRQALPVLEELLPVS